MRLTALLMYRIIDGVCNNLNPKHQLQGASSTAFRCLLQPIYEDGISLHSTIKGAILLQVLAIGLIQGWLYTVVDTIFSIQLTNLAMTWANQHLDLFTEFETYECEESLEFDQIFPFAFPSKLK